MHGADRIVVVEFRHALENGAAVFGLGQMKTHQFADRRLRQRAADDGFEKAEPVVGFEDVRRHHAVFYFGHGGPRLNQRSLPEVLTRYRVGMGGLRWRSHRGRWSRWHGSCAVSYTHLT